MTAGKIITALGAFNAMLAVLLGAFGTHALKARLSEADMAIYQTASQYHFYHALGMILVGILINMSPESSLLKSSGWIMLAGIVLFSGSLYCLPVTQIRWLGAITPLGGTAFIISWVCVVVAVLKTNT